MDFFINKNSTLPILIMELIMDGRNDYMNTTYNDLLENSSLTFSMRNVKNNKLKIANKEAEILLKPSIYNDENSMNKEYYLAYKWTEKDTNEIGRFEGQFKLIFHTNNTELIVPIREKLYININDSFVKSNVI